MKTSYIILAIAVLLGVAASFGCGWDFARKHYQGHSSRPDTVYLEKWLPAPIPEPADSVRVETRIVYLPVHDTIPYAVHDTLHHTDSVLVEVPITEKHYATSDYRATVRGFQPELVDMWIRQKEVQITTPYRKRWGFTVGPQIGYGITPKGGQPYAGIGATFGYSF